MRRSTFRVSRLRRFASVLAPTLACLAFAACRGGGSTTQRHCDPCGTPGGTPAGTVVAPLPPPVAPPPPLPPPPPPPPPAAQPPPTPVAATPSNSTCPVLLGNPVDPKVTTTYEGRVVGFCCPVCKARFEKDPEKYAKNLP